MMMGRCVMDRGSVIYTGLLCVWLTVAVLVIVEDNSRHSIRDKSVSWGELYNQSQGTTRWVGLSPQETNVWIESPDPKRGLTLKR